MGILDSLFSNKKNDSIDSGAVPYGKNKKKWRSRS